jgi:hypothetical protein
MIIRKTIIKKKMKKEKVMERNYEFCGCWGVRKVKDAWLDMFSLKKKKNGERSGEIFELFGEIKKLDIEGILDELSDLSWGVGRLIGGLFGKEYVRIWGDERHYLKIKERFEECGCIRSKNNKSNCGRK